MMPRRMRRSRSDARKVTKASSAGSENGSTAEREAEASREKSCSESDDGSDVKNEAWVSKEKYTVGSEDKTKAKMVEGNTTKLNDKVGTSFSSSSSSPLPA